MVTPVDKGGGEAGTTVESEAASFQAAASGGAVAFGSRASFGAGPGAPPISQYLATRGASSWVTENISPPLLSGTYAGGAYQLFSSDLGRALLSSGWRCRDGGSDCEAENPPLAPGALSGYRNVYLREGGRYQPLLTASTSPAMTVSPSDFELSLEGSAPDLRHVVISTCAALTAEAVEVSGSAGCDPAATNLYRWSEGSLAAVNLLPGQSQSAPGAVLAAPSGAISADGRRVYWRGADGNLYLRDGGTSLQVDLTVGGSGQFQTAAADGSVAFFTRAGHLYRYEAGSGVVADLTPTAGVQGVLGAGANGALVYYLTGSGLFLWQGGTAAKIAATADAGNTPPATGTSYLSADGTRLAFVSTASLNGFANAGRPEVYLYDSTADRLTCVSCNPYGVPPAGDAALPSVRAAGGGPAVYRPRALSAGGARLYFESADRLVDADTDAVADVYEWEAQGSGSCIKPGGCVALISNGRAAADSFLDASADGADVFFLTSASLAPADRAGLDVYDARVGGGFPESPPPAPCEGDDCQGPAPAPVDVTPGTAAEGFSNPPARFTKEGRPRKHNPKRKKHRARKHRHGSRRGTS